MYYTLSPGNIVGLSDLAIASNVDPLGLKKCKVDLKDHDLCQDFMGELVDEALNQPDSETRRTLMQWPSLHTMNLVTAELIFAMGADPATVLVLGETLASRDKHLKLIEQIADGEERIVIERGYGVWEIRLEQDVEIHWHRSFEANVYLPHLPLSFSDGMTGEKLSRYISHPVLDRFDIPIKSTYNDQSATTSILIEVEQPVLNKDELIQKYQTNIAAKDIHE